jgi:hypothetical protein
VRFNEEVEMIWWGTLSKCWGDGSSGFVQEDWAFALHNKDDNDDVEEEFDDDDDKVDVDVESNDTFDDVVDDDDDDDDDDPYAEMDDVDEFNLPVADVCFSDAFLAMAIKLPPPEPEPPPPPFEPPEDAE